MPVNFVCFYLKNDYYNNVSEFVNNISFAILKHFSYNDRRNEISVIARQSS